MNLLSCSPHDHIKSCTLLVQIYASLRLDLWLLEHQISQQPSICIHPALHSTPSTKFSLSPQDLSLLIVPVYSELAKPAFFWKRCFAQSISPRSDKGFLAWYPTVRYINGHKRPMPLPKSLCTRSTKTHSSKKSHSPLHIYSRLKRHGELIWVKEKK